MSTPPISDAIINVIVENEVAETVDVTDLDVSIPAIDIVLGQQGPKGDPGLPGVSGAPVPVVDECGDLTVWTKWGVGTGTLTIATITDSSVVVGGKVIRCVGRVQSTRTPMVPFDPKVLYRVKFRVRQTVNSTDVFYAGLEGVAADGVTLVNSTGANSPGGASVVAAAVALTVAQGWQEFVGYVKGFAAVGSNSSNFACPSPYVPGNIHANVRYIRPYFYANINGTETGTQEIDYVSLEIVPEPVTPLPLYDEGSSLTEWFQYSGTGTVSVAQVADSSVGGKVLSFAGQANLVRTPLVPYDPTALYRIKFRARRTVNPGTGSNNINAGFEGVAADGVTTVTTDGFANRAGPQHTVAASGVALVVAGGWQEFTGYVKGVAAFGTAVAAPSPSSPGVMHQNVRYIRPFVSIGSGDAAGRAEVDYVSLEIVPQVATGGTEVTLSGDGTAGAPLSAALTGTRSGGWSVAGNLGVTGVVNLGNEQVTIGTATGGSFWQPNVTLQRMVSGKLSLAIFAVVDENTPLGILLRTNSIDRGRLEFAVDSVSNLPHLRMNDGVGVVRPIPFATLTASVSVPVVSSTTGTFKHTYSPAGRFTRPPMVMMTVAGTSSYVAYNSDNSTDGSYVTVGVRHINDVSGSATVIVNILAVQMTPASALG